MKVLIVTRQLGRSYFQGTERYVLTLGRELRDRGHQAIHLAGDPLGLDGRLELGALADPEESIFAHPTRGWLTVEGVASDRLTHWIAAQQPDVVHVTNPAHVGIGALRSARRLGLATVVTTMDFWWVCPRSTLLRPDARICDGSPGWQECTRCLAVPQEGSSTLERLGRAAARLSPWIGLTAAYLHQARRGTSIGEAARWTRRRDILLEALDEVDHVIFPSRSTRDAISARLSHARWSMIPYGLSGEWFEPTPRGPVRKPPEELVVGYAGALLPHKAPHLLLDAVRQLGWRRTRVRIAGPPADRAYWERLVAGAQGLAVEFLDLVPPQDMPGFLRSLDVLAVTSVWPENLPFVILEAQAAGVAVIASDVAGIVDQVPEPRCRFAPGDVEGLAGALEFVRAQAAVAGRARVSTIAEAASATEAVYAAAREHTAASETRAEGSVARRRVA